MKPGTSPRGCRRVSPGCEHCYAERQANRFKGPGKAYEGLIKLVGGKPRWSGETKFSVEHLADPLRWRKPRRIFVDSMSDLFYEGFTNEQIAEYLGGFPRGVAEKLVHDQVGPAPRQKR
jgi:protein gp37